MNITQIRNDDELRAAFNRLELVFQAQEGTAEADETEILVTLIEAYEHKHYPSGPADPVEALPAYEADDGPFTAKQIAALRKDAAEHLPQGKPLARQDLFH